MLPVYPSGTAFDLMEMVYQAVRDKFPNLISYFVSHSADAALATADVSAAWFVVY